MDFIKVENNMTPFPFPYGLALYRRNNFGQPCVWYAQAFDDTCVTVFHGIVGKTITRELIITKRDAHKEVASRKRDKRKAGYKLLSELKDNVELPVEGELLNYLSTYLPTDRTTADGNMLPMLAKVYDNTNNKIYSKVPCYIGQWKINGLRCFISAVVNDGDLFKPVSLVFQSREGTIWNSLTDLEDYLLHVIDNKLLEKMVDEHYILDGELYLPGHTVNEINHFVKDATCQENKLIQYWCYDIAIENTIQETRNDILFKNFACYMKSFKTKEDHYNNKERLVALPTYKIASDDRAIWCRNYFIDMGFEGLILRNPRAEYQYGKRNSAMIKYKKTTDGMFTIVDIYPEGVTRNNIPLFLLRNDINDATFEVHINGSQQYQSRFLNDAVKENTIGKKMFVSYGERSGVNELPFHVKEVKLLKI